MRIVIPSRVATIVAAAAVAVSLVLAFIVVNRDLTHLGQRQP